MFSTFKVMQIGNNLWREINVFIGCDLEHDNPPYLSIDAVYNIVHYLLISTAIALCQPIDPPAGVSL